MNVNKLFPRLSIRWKLGIAFAVVALVPLAVTSAIGVRVTAGQLRATTQTAMERDLVLAESQTARSLREAQRHVQVIAEDILGPLLGAGDTAALREAEAVVTSLLAAEPEMLGVELVDSDGRILFEGSASGSRSLPEGEEFAGLFYAWLGESAPGGRTQVQPVELRGADGRNPTAAVAIVKPVRGAGGEYLGAVIGEGLASGLFSEIENGAADVAGETGLVDAEGLFLYHSERKRDWATLLASRSQINLQSDFPAEVAASIVAGKAGTITLDDGRIVSFRPLSVTEAGLAPLTLYRVVPLERVGAPVRRFLTTAGLAGVGLFAAILVLAAVAAEQFTRPIFRLREGAHRLAGGEADVSVTVDTNDELEDLARDFAAMADALTVHRRRLEELVVERTRELSTANAELSGILTHSADAIVFVDNEDRIRVWNHGAERLFGVSVADAIGREVSELIGPRGDGALREREYIRRELVRHGAVVNFRTERGGKGNSLPVSLTQTVIRDNAAKPLGSSLILRDARLEARLGEQMRRSERLAAISVMAAGLAHELNNPLGIIMNRIECMQQDVREAFGETALDRDLSVLREHVGRLATVTTDLLRFAREDSEEAAPVQLDALAQRMRTLLEPTFVRRRLSLRFEPPPFLPAVHGHEKAIETVLVNLLLNAADATPAEGTITIALRELASEAAVEMEIRDTGPGIAPELRERIFEPFFTTKGERGGTGLGLTVCRSIVERHRGSMRVETADGAGAAFVVRLPLRPFAGA